ncbi:MAG TPA: DMT family transporter [Candidatus Polarisedimenticolaceae bacterium]|nr:DMT family transporter [Candidatus Polarisedimenticolaceae bacterium]
MTRAAFATLLALVAFASNSILCRLALRAGAIDPASFTAIRLVSGAVVLSILVAARKKTPAAGARRPWLAAFWLTLYAVPFSWAYVDLPAGTGSLLAFASVQITMIVVSIVRGSAPTLRQWGGLVIAFLGVVWLVLPGVAAPRPANAALMIVAGAAWGFYTLGGRGSTDPLGQTARNFVWSLPYVFVVCALTWPRSVPATSGVVCAIASGALASGLGYAIWYEALRSLSAIPAASVQLATPVITAAGGIAFLGETLSLRLVESSVLVLGGIGLTFARSRRGPS